MDIYEEILDTFSLNPCSPKPRSFEEILQLMPTTFSAVEVEAALTRLEACGSIYRQAGRYHEAGMSRDEVVDERAGYGGTSIAEKQRDDEQLTSFDGRYTIHGIRTDTWRFK